VFADNFLAGALITLLIPASVLVAVVVWYARTILRQSREDEIGRAAGTTAASAAEEKPSGATP
jgi:hypothetical protein